jgi:hypothetical protein
MRYALISMAFLAITPAATGAEPVSGLSVSYNVDVGPMTVIVVKYRLGLSEEGLSSDAQIRSNGVSRMFSEYSAKAEAESLTSKGGIAPLSFKLVRANSDPKKHVTLQWGAGGITYAPQEKKAERRARIETALTDDVADPMTAVLRIGTAGEDPCPSVQQVFDGRDVYELSLSDKGAGKLDGESAWRGPVRVCEVNWTPIAGRAAEKNEPRESYEVSFAAVGDLPNGRTLWLPVALNGKLKGIRFDAYASRIKRQAVAEGGAEGGE